MKTALLIFSIIAIATGCATAPSHNKTHQMITAFNESEFLPYAAYGSGTIQGQAFLKTRGGDVRYGAGNTVSLIPVNAYSKEVWQASLLGEVAVKDPRWIKYVRECVADGSGNFEFTKIPAGEYYLECPIFWEVPGPNGLFRSGAVVKSQIRIGDMEVLKVVLTQ